MKLENKRQDPEAIKGILRSILPELSRAWSETARKTCACGAEYDDLVWHMQDGRITEQNACRECRRKDVLEQKRKELEAELAHVVERQEDEWYINSGLSGVFICKTFNNFDPAVQLKAFNAVKTLAWQTKSLVLLSPGLYGVGKTHLVSALVNQIIKSEEKAVIKGSGFYRYRCPVFITGENQLLRRIRDTYNKSDDPDKETEDDIYNKLSHNALLIIDDVGKVRPRDPTFLQGVYFNIIDQRYTDEQSVILTTNLDFAELEAHIGGACADRLREMCGKTGFIKMVGKSYRHKD